jgi:hypothetical protein
VANWVRPFVTEGGNDSTSAPTPENGVGSPSVNQRFPVCGGSLLASGSRFDVCTTVRIAGDSLPRITFAADCHRRFSYIVPFSIASTFCETDDRAAN